MGGYMGLGHISTLNPCFGLESARNHIILHDMQDEMDPASKNQTKSWKCFIVLKLMLKICL